MKEDEINSIFKEIFMVKNPFALTKKNLGRAI